MTEEPQQKFRHKERKRIAAVAGVIAVLAAVASLWVMWPDSYKLKNSWVPWVATFWTLGPPLWFFIEVAWLFKEWGDPKEVAIFTRLQEHAAKIWAGMLALLTGSIFLLEKS